MTKHMETKKRLREISSISELSRLIDDCVLSDNNRKIARMIYLEDKPLGYIADVLGYSESCVKKRHVKIVERLEKLLNEKGQE